MFQFVKFLIYELVKQSLLIIIVIVIKVLIFIKATYSNHALVIFLTGFYALTVKTALLADEILPVH